MSLNRLFYFLALLFTVPVAGFGQVVPVAPGMLLDIGGFGASAISKSLKFDAQGNIYVAGNFQMEVDFDPSGGVVNENTSNRDAFVAKYSAAGNFVWVKVLGGGGSQVSSLDIDRYGNLTVLGETAPGYIPQQINPPVTNARGVFIWHLDNDGSTLWKKFIVGTANGIFTMNRDTQGSVASDAAGNVIAICPFRGSADVDGNVTAKGVTDGLVIKYDPNGDVIWKFSLGAAGEGDNSVMGVSVDKDNNIIIAGYTNGTVDYNPMGTPVNVTARTSMFLASYSPAGILHWIKSINGLTSNFNVKLALDGQNNVYINGAFSSPLDFGVTPTLMPKGNQDIFIAKYSSGGNLLYYKSIAGINTSVLNREIVAGPDGSLYLTGVIKGKADFDPSASVAEVSSSGFVGMFLAKYDDNGNYQWAFAVPVAGSGVIDLSTSDFLVGNGAHDVNVNSSNEIFLAGTFGGTINFDGTGCSVSKMTAQGNGDMFIVSYTPTTLTPIINNTITEPAVTAICPDGDPDLITGSVPTGNVYTYQWQQSLNNITYTDIPGAVSRDFDPPIMTATTYYRRRLVSSVCAAPNISNVVTITLLTRATPNTITAPSVTSFCTAGDAGLIRGSVPQAIGNVDYQWQQSTDNISFTNISGATTKDFDPPVAGTTTYYRRLITNSPCSIGTPTNTVTITIIPVPLPTVSAEQTICVGDGVTLNATGGTRYSWSPVAGLSATDIASPKANPIATTNYMVTVFNGNCSTVLSVKVTVVDRPTVNAGADKEIMNGDRLQLNAQVSAVEGATYSWTPATYLDNPTIASPVASPTGNITYRLTATSAKGCFIVSDDVSINVHEKIMIPNTFTPNGDGINDILTIAGLDSYKQSILTIFDRSGQQIFKSLAYPKPWDGTRNGKPLPMGIYYYILELNYDHKRLSGYVTLIK